MARRDRQERGPGLAPAVGAAAGATSTTASNTIALSSTRRPWAIHAGMIPGNVDMSGIPGTLGAAAIIPSSMSK